MERNLTTGSVFRTVIRFSVPFLLSYFLQTLYGMADLYIIGQFHGVESVTAVSIGSQVMHMLTVMIVGLAMGTTVMVGRAIGARSREQAARTIGNTITLFLPLSVILTLVLLLSVKGIVRLTSTPTEAVPGTISYLSVCFTGILSITAYNVISAVFRGLGDSKSPLYFVALACAANIALDYLFIGVLGMGPAGAALGTTISQTLSVVISLAFVLRKKGGITLHASDFKPDRNTMGALMKVGVPVALQDGFIQIAFIAISVFANRRGLNDAAAVGIVEKISGILFLVPSTMLSTVSAVCAQNIGAGKLDRARHTLGYAIMLTVTWGVAVAIVMQWAAEPTVALFVDEAADGAEVIRLGGQYMRGYVWDCIFAGIHFSFSGYFCACGASIIPFAHNVISVLCARVPLSYFASRHYADTLFPMGLASPAGSIVSVTICIGVYAWMCRRQCTKEMNFSQNYSADH